MQSYYISVRLPHLHKMLSSYRNESNVKERTVSQKRTEKSKESLTTVEVVQKFSWTFYMHF